MEPLGNFHQELPSRKPGLPPLFPVSRSLVRLVVWRVVRTLIILHGNHGFSCLFCLSLLRSQGQYLSVICSVPGRCLVRSSCGTIAQQERTGQTHPSEVVWPIMSWRIRERLLVASQPGERWRYFLCFLFLELFFLLTSIYPLEVPWRETEPSLLRESFPMTCGYGGRN